MLGATVFHSRTSMPFLQGTTLQNPSLATEESIMNLHFHLLSKKNLKILLSMCFFSHHHIFTKKKKTWKISLPPLPHLPHGAHLPHPGPAGTWCWAAAWPRLPGGQRRRHGNPTALGQPIPLARPATTPGDGPQIMGETSVVMLTMDFHMETRWNAMWWFFTLSSLI